VPADSSRRVLALDPLPVHSLSRAPSAAPGFPP
jgi:hypothetical protein